MNGIVPEDLFEVQTKDGRKTNWRGDIISLEYKPYKPAECIMCIEARYADNHPAAFPTFKSTRKFEADNSADVKIYAKMLCPTFLQNDIRERLGGNVLINRCKKGKCL